MHKTKIKICGITQIAIAEAFSYLAIDAIGLVFYKQSPRCVSITQANAIINALPPFINRVGLFVNANPNDIEQVLKQVSIDTLQFHGDETPAQCMQYQLPFIKAVRVNQQTNLKQFADDYHQASGLLLDAYHLESFGGTGKVFDWALAKQSLVLPIILAGGLNPDNVAQAIKQTKPYGVDVSSGVESVKGVKDLTKIKQFIKQTHGL